MHFAFHVKNGDCNLHWTALVAHRPEGIFISKSVSNSHFDFHLPAAVSHPVNYVWSPGFSWFVVARRTAVMCGLRAKAVLGGTEDAGRNHLPYVAKGRRTLTKPESHGRLARTHARSGRRFYRHPRKVKDMQSSTTGTTSKPPFTSDPYLTRI